jgi:hypothetical protein
MCTPPRAIIRVFAAALLSSFCAVSASAQDARLSATADVPRKVLHDPTTFATTIVSFELRQLDWKSSQVFFRHGWLEHNRDYTITGFSDGSPIGYTEGRRKNIELALVELPIAVAHNVVERALEQRMINRDPSHRGLWRTLGWIERVSFASYRASLVSSHYAQWQRNQQLARQLGYK